MNAVSTLVFDVMGTVVDGSTLAIPLQTAR
jgi:hypothetical protein